MVLEQDTFILAKYWFNPEKTRPCLIEILLMGRKESNQSNKQKSFASRLKSGGRNSKPLIIFFQSCTFFFQSK